MERDEYELKFEKDLYNEKIKISYEHKSITAILLAAFLSAIFTLSMFICILKIPIISQYFTEIINSISILFYPLHMFAGSVISILIYAFAPFFAGFITAPYAPHQRKAFRDVFFGCVIGIIEAIILQSIILSQAIILQSIIFLSILDGIIGSIGALLGLRVRRIRTAEAFVEKVEMEGEYLRFMGEYERMVLLYEKALNQLIEGLKEFKNKPPEYADTLVAQIKTKLIEGRNLAESIGYTVVSPVTIEEGVQALRGCEVIGGRFEYKVKVNNKSKHVITDVHIRIVGYPDDSLNLAGEAVRTVSRIEIGGFRSPQFIFTPTRDCVEGKVHATVSFMDPQDKIHTIEVKPYIIKSVCDLLNPFETTTTQFNLLLENMKSDHQDHVLPINPIELHGRIEALLLNHNFHVIDKDETSVGGQYLGTMKGLAKGKYSEKKVAIAVSVVGNEEGKESSVSIDILGEDLAMIPITMEEFSQAIRSWTCPGCGGPISPEQLILLRSGNEIECSYCHELVKLNDYSKGDT